MPFEDFDKKIKEAAEHHSSPGNEDAWEKMESLLNKHLPQKRSNNRMIFLLLFAFLLLGGGAYILVKKPFGSRAEGSITETKSGSPAEKQNTPPRETTLENLNANELNNDKVNNEPATGLPGNGIDLNEWGKDKKNPRNYAENKQGDLTITDNKADKPIQDITNNEKNQLPGNIKQPPPLNQNELLKEDKKVTAETKLPATDINPQQPSSVAKDGSKENKPAKAKTGFLRNLAFTLSAGPELSFVEVNDMGRIRLAYGAGLSFPLSKNISIRTGFNMTRKIYSAGPEDYYPSSPAFWSYYPNLKQIDADCKIYEVPLTVDYNFGKTQNRSWFASAGVSSLFMKRESYNYTFKPPSSTQYISYTHTYNNENRHYFSMLNISGGYTRKLSDIVSLHAEPFVKIPLSGIGHGNIKLGSGGVLFTASIKPFASKKNQKQ